MKHAFFCARWAQVARSSMQYKLYNIYLLGIAFVYHVRIGYPPCSLRLQCIYIYKDKNISERYRIILGDGSPTNKTLSIQSSKFIANFIVFIVMTTFSQAYTDIQVGNAKKFTALCIQSSVKSVT